MKTRVSLVIVPWLVEAAQWLGVVKPTCRQEFTLTSRFDAYFLDFYNH